MRKTRWVWVFVLGVSLMGCASSIGTSLGKIIGFDADGHVTKDITYNMSASDTFTLKTDGTFSQVSMDFEGTTADINNNGVTNEGWVQTDGMRGTYVYYPDRFYAVATMSESFSDPGTGAYTWIPNTNANDPKVNNLHMIPFEHTMYMNQPSSYSSPSKLSVFVKGADSATWIGSNSMTMNSGESYYFVSTFTIAPSTNVCNVLFGMYAYSNNALIMGQEKNYTGTISSQMPVDETWKKGAAITFITEYSRFYREFDGTNWTAWGDEPGYSGKYMINYAFVNHGDFILLAPLPYAMCNIELE